MKVLIVEDEMPAATKLQKLLAKIGQDNPFEVLEICGSVESTIAFFKQASELPELIFMDVQLTDGLSFDIFKAVDIKVPVIFITAYNQYSIDAFKANGIDYLLKPLQLTDLEKSLSKFRQFTRPLATAQPDNQQLAAVFEQLTKKSIYKERFLVKVGDHIRSVNARDVALFYADGRIVYLYLHEKARYVIDFKLESLTDILDPDIFFRVNRSFIININAIKEVLVYSNSRLKIVLHEAFEHEIIVSREKVQVFKAWFAGETS